VLRKERNKMMIDIMVLIILPWNAIGFFLCICWNQAMEPDGWELCNPCEAYWYYRKVNWFGAIVLSLVYTALCPIGALIYWFYKLCTVGRK
jgi:hypothetical protein